MISRMNGHLSLRKALSRATLISGGFRPYHIPKFATTPNCTGASFRPATTCHDVMKNRFFSTGSDGLPYHLVVGLPALSPTMESGTLAEWYLKEGDSFSAGDAIAKIETDKAAMDFEAQDDGFVAKILQQAGQGNDIAIGTPIMITVEDSADVAAFQNYTAPAAAVAPSAAATATTEPSPPPPVAPAAPMVAATPPPPAAAATIPPPVVSPPPPPAPVTVTTIPSSFSTSWGLSVVDTSPLAQTLAVEQKAYIALYGTTGQSPIL